jgi:hypothetical protein
MPSAVDITNQFPTNAGEDGASGAAENCTQFAE